MLPTSPCPGCRWHRAHRPIWADRPGMGCLVPPVLGTPVPVTESEVLRKQIRRRLQGRGGSVNVASDVQMVVAGDGQASSKQSVRVSQRGAQAGTTADEGGATADTEEKR